MDDNPFAPPETGYRSVLKYSTEVRRLAFLALGFTIFGLIFGGVNFQSAVSSIANARDFSHGVHASGVVESTQKAKGLYVSIGVKYSVDGAVVTTSVADPNSVKESLDVGQSVDIVYLPADPKRAAIAGQYATGFQASSLVFGLLGIGVLVAGVAFGFRGLRLHRQTRGLREPG